MFDYHLLVEERNPYFEHFFKAAFTNLDNNLSCLFLDK